MSFVSTFLSFFFIFCFFLCFFSLFFCLQVHNRDGLHDKMGLRTEGPKGSCPTLIDLVGPRSQLVGIWNQLRSLTGGSMIRPGRIFKGILSPLAAGMHLYERVHLSRYMKICENQPFSINQSQAEHVVNQNSMPLFHQT